MRNLMNLLSLVCLLTLSATAFAQKSDPFGGDPFAGNPFSDGRHDRAAKSKEVAAKAEATRTPSEALWRIRAALDEQTSQSFVELPLSDVVQIISETHDIPLVVDNRALEEIGLSAEEPVSLTLNKISLRSFLHLMLLELDLTYVIKDEVMIVTTVESALEDHRVLEMYALSAELAPQAHEVVKALTTSVSPDDWEINGGPCTVMVVDNVLVVSAIEPIQEQIIDFLDKIQRAIQLHRKS